MQQVELKSGETYRGELHEAEDNWNCQLKNITATAKVSVFAFSSNTGILTFASCKHVIALLTAYCSAGWEDITFRAHLHQRKSNQVTNVSGVASFLHLRSCEIILGMTMNCKQCMLNLLRSWKKQHSFCLANWSVLQVCNHPGYAEECSHVQAHRSKDEGAVLSSTCH